MLDNVLPTRTTQLLNNFDSSDLPDGAYLAGGTACALWLGHRRSVDLDFFTPREFSVDQWRQQWETKFNFKMFNEDWQTLEGEGREVKLALYYYKYPLIKPPQPYQAIQVAQLEDIAAMKLETLVNRGTKRDFIDLYFLTKKFGLKAIFCYYDRKYGNLDERELLLRKALIYFADAEDDEMPDMLQPIDWKSIKKYFESLVL